MNTALEIRSPNDLRIIIFKRLVAKRSRNLFKRVPSGLNIVEPREASGEEAEAGDDQVEVAVNAGESVGRNHADDEVEDPV
jgi:hypothetical protein